MILILGTSNHCNLREAIVEANQDPVKDIIKFNLPSGQNIIRISSNLPTIINPLIIDGTSQFGYSGKPIVTLKGDKFGTLTGIYTTQIGLSISSDDVTVKGLSIVGFVEYGILVKEKIVKEIGGGFDEPIIDDFEGVSNNIIEGNYIGIWPDGIALDGNGLNGIELVRAKDTKIGGPTEQERNVISGNEHGGIRIIDGICKITYTFNNNQVNSNTEYCWGNPVYPHDNLIQNNFIGTDPTGRLPIPNKQFGIALVNSHNNIINTGNIISANKDYNIIIIGKYSHNNQIIGNLIGTDVSGTNAFPNQNSGITITSWPSTNPNKTTGPPYNNFIGGLNDKDRNIISGHIKNGIDLLKETRNNFIRNNFIGLDITGNQPLGNGLNGINIEEV